MVHKHRSQISLEWWIESLFLLQFTGHTSLYEQLRDVKQCLYPDNGVAFTPTTARKWYTNSDMLANPKIGGFRLGGGSAPASVRRGILQSRFLKKPVVLGTMVGRHTLYQRLKPTSVSGLAPTCTVTSRRVYPLPESLCARKEIQEAKRCDDRARQMLQFSKSITVIDVTSDN
ncbi:hypothetical protein SARC_12662 [Sphaeroforma arctica JP610]|uniref:Uncharacterized protein n=1 Tax=Sphaeroforma arctica JP610 TaxID=667725 RepID=A0A0L0FDG1_9EUKA|nr:hypothetical protein SARC_12662 [Sphaeroforma arctica JP610]KNC74802.1 hypothetical protein SARC_12662 [Sphaeroforma arctica JP610]|eukprot:XP_014148704.1 hypothetical protein SARC_12662 [Sphaeroforma arctica JP610]